MDQTVRGGKDRCFLTSEPEGLGIIPGSLCREEFPEPGIADTVVDFNDNRGPWFMQAVDVVMPDISGKVVELLARVRDLDIPAIYKDPAGPFRITFRDQNIDVLHQAGAMVGIQPVAEGGRAFQKERADAVFFKDLKHLLQGVEKGYIPFTVQFKEMLKVFLKLVRQKCKQPVLPET